jgi:hypothetical protein
VTDRGERVLVIVDGENVRRSRWPNLTQRELLDRSRDWAGRERHDLFLVYDGAAPEQAPDVASAPHADDLIAAAVARERRPVWLVTSDRALRARAASAARLVGGGTFLAWL